MNAWLLVVVAAAGAVQLAAAADVCSGRPLACQGCGTVVVCAQLDGVNFSPVASVSCSRAAPFCSAGRCVSAMAADNPCDIAPQPSDNFSCPANHTGYLPDPFDCSGYHYCVDGVGWDYKCLPSMVYRHSTASCVPRSAAPCWLPDCPYTPTDVLYGPDNSVSFRCEGPGRVTVQQCEENHRLDLGTRRCVRYCPRAGRQPAASTTLYYECLVSAAGTASQPVLKACPQGSTFNAILERCEGTAD